jgi:hypothetical protein
MRSFLIILIGVLTISCSREQGCDEISMPYWANGINSKMEGENITLRRTFQTLQQSETDITPRSGFITLRMHISRNGTLCGIETFEIDSTYNPISFNEGKLIEKLKVAATGIKEWRKEKDVKTYNLIRLKIDDGKIMEVF